MPGFNLPILRPKPVKASKALASGTKTLATSVSALLIIATLAYATFRVVDSFRQDRAGPSYGYVVDDWPDGGHSDKDHWRGGVFFGFKADRIRHVSKPKGDTIDGDSLRFFARLPMSDNDFDDLLDRLQRSEESSYRELQHPDYANLFLIPQWFPDPAEAVRFARCRDDSNWPTLIIRGRDGFTYLHLN